MTVLALVLTILGLSTWMGAVVFLTFMVNPVLSRKLGPTKTAEVMDSISPRFYIQGVTGGGLMLAGGIAALTNESIRLQTIIFLVLTGICMGIFLYAWTVILPRTVNLRRRLQSSAGFQQENLHIRDRYDHANFLANFFNGVVLVLLVMAATTLAFLLASTTGTAE